MIIKFIKEAWFMGRKMKVGEVINTVCKGCALEAIKKGDAVECKQGTDGQKSQ